MLSNKYFCLLFIVIATISIYPQKKSSITGVISDENKSPVENANVRTEETYSTVSNKEGRYEIKNLTPGDYTLVASSVGYKTQRIPFSISEGEALQLNFVLNKDNIEIDDVVVTGTRTEKNKNLSPVKTEVISSAEIQQMAFTRLDDILLEQPGVSVVDEPWGKGVQLQGLDPAYTLILIDGEPLIGRPGGTLELTRFSVTNLKQVEIVKGASSSLYGSDALAGVINLITEKPDDPFNLRIQSYYKTNNTIDLRGNASINRDNFLASIFFDRLSSDNLYSF